MNRNINKLSGDYFYLVIFYIMTEKKIELIKLRSKLFKLNNINNNSSSERKQ